MITSQIDSNGGTTVRVSVNITCRETLLFDVCFFFGCFEWNAFSLSLSLFLEFCAETDKGEQMREQR